MSRDSTIEDKFSELRLQIKQFEIKLAKLQNSSIQRLATIGLGATPAHNR
jgi:hypothetical protein